MLTIALSSTQNTQTYCNLAQGFGVIGNIKRHLVTNENITPLKYVLNVSGSYRFLYK